MAVHIKQSPMNNGFHCGAQVNPNKTYNENAVSIGKLGEISSLSDEINDGIQFYDNVKGGKV